MLNEEQESEDRKPQPVRISFIPTEKHLFFPSTLLKKRGWDNKLWKLCNVHGCSSQGSGGENKVNKIGPFSFFQNVNISIFSKGEM